MWYNWLLLLLLLLGSQSTSSFFHTMRRQFTGDEWRYIRGDADETTQLSRFYRLWVRVLHKVTLLFIPSTSKVTFIVHSLHVWSDLYRSFLHVWSDLYRSFPPCLKWPLSFIPSTSKVTFIVHSLHVWSDLYRSFPPCLKWPLLGLSQLFTHSCPIL